MKFSEQGLEKIENYSSVDLKIEGLEPKDFKDVVVLTVDEAKDLYGLCFNLYHNRWILPAFDLEEAFNFLEERIGQAKIKHLKKEIAQLKKEQARDNLEIERLEENYKNLTYSVLEFVGTEKNNG